MIYIGEPYISKGKITSKLICEIRIEDVSYEIYYEVENKYSEYLFFERADCFIVAILPIAMSTGQNITVSAAVSEKLLHNFSAYLIPTLAKYIFKNEITIETDKEPLTFKKGNAVGTGLSSGVDSFHTISTHVNQNIESFNLTHLTFFNVGSHGDNEYADFLYRERLENAKEIARKLNFDLIEINSNISDILKMSFIQTHTFRSFSAVLALQKLFGTYYYASGYPISEFKISPESSAYYDLLNTMYLTTENTAFYSAGIEKSRLEKVEDISEFELSYNYLNVCTEKEYNCGVCEKCVRTQLELYSIKKLERYKEVFDLQKFYSNLKYHLGFLLTNLDQSNYSEIKDKLDMNNISIPYSSYLIALGIYFKKKLKKIIKKAIS